MLSLHKQAAVEPLSQALLPGGLRMAYQPIVRLEDDRIVAHEALMRFTRMDCTPLEMLDLARRQGRQGELEIAAARAAAEQFDYAVGGRLLVNLSSSAILQGAIRPQQVLESLGESGRDLSRFVIELTEREIVEDAAQLAEAIGYLRAAGIRLALDDFGNGHSNFELWHELAPEFVKIDRFLINGIADSAGRLAIVKALVEVAASFGTALIAEGVEREADLIMVRDLGIRFAQGYLLGMPRHEVACDVPEHVKALPSAKRPVHPLSHRVTGHRKLTAAHMLIDAPALRQNSTNQDTEALFRAHPSLHALPVVLADGSPLGLINRRVFNERMAMPFARELHGRKLCTLYMHPSPIVSDVHQSVDGMVDILRGEDQRYLSDGFIITENGCYRGLGTGEALVRRVTELRIEAARYANPLTLLPGNIPIAEHIGRLLDGTQEFFAAYADLNHFKPFNDQYGYFRGDRMIQLAADTLLRHVQPSWDFVGHVGGDDFVVLFQSEDWAQRCDRIVAEFNASALQLFDAEDVTRGVLESEDRSGRYSTFPLSTMSIGVACISLQRFTEPEQVASLAAAAKRQAKRNNVGVHVLWGEEIPVPAG